MNSSSASSGGKPVNVTVLGSGDAFASAGRSQSGYFIKAGSTHILLEAGPELLGSLKRKGFNPADIDIIVISHLHGDHFGGLPFLMLEYMWEGRPRRPVRIIGPRHLESRCWKMMKIAYPHFDLAAIRPWLRFIELAPGHHVRTGALKVSAIRSPHTNPDVSLSVKLEIGGRTIVFSGDSGWNEELVTFSEGANLFICECTYYESSHLTFHMNYPQLEANRDRFKVDRMILTHLGREVLNHQKEVTMELASDGLKIAV